MKLKEIRKLCDEATPGPWHLAREEMSVRSDSVGKAICGLGYLMEMEESVGVEPSDCKFIAAARELIPKLLAVAEAVSHYQDSVAMCIDLRNESARPYMVQARAELFDTMAKLFNNPKPPDPLA